MRADSRAHLWDAVEACRLIREFAAGVTAEVYSSDHMRRAAVEREIEILGEALNRLRRSDPAVGRQIPDLGKIVGMRNIIAHEYGSVDDLLVWTAATRRIPVLETLLQAILDSSAS